MKKLIFLGILLLAAGLSVAPAQAEKFQLGADAAMKVDYFHFTDSTIGNLNAENGMYVGAEFYKQLFFPNFFLGFEVGWAGTTGQSSLGVFHFDTDFTYIPLQFNAKYVVPINPMFDFVFGGGLSYNYIDMNNDIIDVSTGGAGSGSVNDWVFGGQFFTEVNWKVTPCFFIGLNVQYQLTDDISFNSVSTDASADNVRAGFHVGYKF
ncbi:MAG: porin family protein [Desulfobacteraceae bacterium]|nr:porin family protein [Desulfobacteraceae bacterium]